MNKKGFELAISTLILIVIGVIVLVAIAYALTDGFKKFGKSTEPFTDTSQATAVKHACSIACDSSDKLTFCCKEYEIDGRKIKCEDSRLEISCALDCGSFNCE